MVRAPDLAAGRNKHNIRLHGQGVDESIQRHAEVVHHRRRRGAGVDEQHDAHRVGRPGAGDVAPGAAFRNAELFRLEVPDGSPVPVEGADEDDLGDPLAVSDSGMEPAITKSRTPLADTGSASSPSRGGVYLLERVVCVVDGGSLQFTQIMNELWILGLRRRHRRPGAGYFRFCVRDGRDVDLGVGRRSAARRANGGVWRVVRPGDVGVPRAPRLALSTSCGRSSSAAPSAFRSARSCSACSIRTYSSWCSAPCW